MALYLSRLVLRDDPPIAALKALIDPTAESTKSDAHHRLLWSVFSDGPERKRDFLWRAEPNGKFYTLSRRPPVNSGLFETPESKVFSPELSAGDRLSFLLRANAVKSISLQSDSEKVGQRSRGKKVDVAMHLLHEIPGLSNLADGMPSQRAKLRFELASKASGEWLARQGERNGFELDSSRFTLNDYSKINIPGNRRKKKSAPAFGVFDMSGVLTVTDPKAFVARLALGFGRAKAFGQGLMLIRRF